MKRIVVLVDAPFTPRDQERFGIDIFRANGFDVDVWDLTPCLRPNNHSGAVSIARRFLNLQDAVQTIEALDRHSFIVSFVHHRPAALPVFRALSRTGVRYGVVETTGFPPFNVVRSPRDFMAQLSRLLHPLSLLPSIFRRIPPRWLGVRPADALFASGARSVRQCPGPLGTKTEIVWAHTLDYDVYLTEREGTDPPPRDLAVFLDGYLPFHGDYLAMGLPMPCQPEEYYPRLCQFFDYIERQLGTRVVIAVHPRAEYADVSEYFGRRQALKGCTAQLVYASRFVITHDSAAVNFAVLFHKPVVFVTTDKLRQHPQHRTSIPVMAAWLSKTPINLDDGEPVQWERQLRVDPDAYERYRYEFIKRPGTPEKISWQIYADYIRSLAG